MKKFNDTGFMMVIRGIIIFFFIIYVFIRFSLSLFWNYCFNKEQYYIMKRELDKF